jgi:hypothetical protein
MRSAGSNAIPALLEQMGEAKMTERHDRDTASWPERPWIMAAICSAAGLLFSQLADVAGSADPAVWRQVAATFVAVATISFVMTVEQRRWQWALGFALGWGLVVAMVGWFTASYNYHSNIAEFPFLSGLFAVLLAAPLFQTVRDEGAWRFPYVRLHGHAWTDAVIGASSIGFIGVTFLLALLIGGLFDLIGISFIKDLIQDEWFAWMLAGFAFGGAVGLLRERDGLVATLQRLAMVVLSVLAPVLAAALALFLLSLPFTGLGGLWDSTLPATPMMLLAAAGAVLLANAVIGNGRDDKAKGRVLRWSALVLVVVVLPLAIIAAISIGARIGQYGWTPERIWGVVAVSVAIAYGLVGWWSAYRGREDFDAQLRPLQTRLAIGLCGLALVLALPVIDFGAISARSQMARLETGKVLPKEFDWQAMAFDFGPAGRKRLAEITRQGPEDQRQLAAAALQTRDRYDVQRIVDKQQAAVNIARQVRVLPQGVALPEGLRQAIIDNSYCLHGPCVVTLIDDHRAVLAGTWGDCELQALVLVREPDGRWNPEQQVKQQAVGAARVKGVLSSPDLATAPVDIRSVVRRQLFIDGKPLGEPFE